MNKPAKWWHITNGNILTDIAVWLILFLPLLLYLGIYEPFGFGRYAMFMAFLTILLLGTLFTFGGAASRSLGVGWWKQPVIWLIIAWWLVAILAAINGVNPARSWWGTVFRGEGLFFLTGLLILGINLLVLVRREGSWLKIFSIMTWVGAISGLYALLQSLKLPLMMLFDSQSGRATGLMGNPIFLGQLLLLTIFFTLYFVYATKGKLRWWYVASLSLQVAGLSMTVSRGPLAGLAVGIVVWLVGWFILHGREKIRMYWSWMIAGVSGIVAIMVGLLYLWPQQWQRLFELGDTVRARLGIWDTAWQAIKARPWLGYGNENARYGLAHYYQSGLADISMPETTTDRAHNLILDQLLTNGWIGLIIMAIIVGYLLWALWRRFCFAKQQNNFIKAILIWSLISTMVAYVVALMFAFDVVTTSVYVAIIITGIIFFISVERDKPVRIPHVFLLATGLLLVGLVFFNIKYLVPAWQIGRYVKSAQTAVKRNDYRSANQFYVKAQEPINPYRWPYLITYPSFTRQYALLLIDQEQNLSSANVILIDGIRVLNNIQKNEPDRIGLFIEYPILYAVRSYIDPNFETKAEESFNDLTNEFPNHEYIYMNWSRALIGIGKYAEARKVLNQLSDKFTVLPKEFEFWRALVDIKLKSSNNQQIIQDLQTTINRGMGFVEGDQDVLRLITAYLVNIKQWRIAEYYQKNIVTLSSKDVTERINLSAIYAELKEYDKAAEQARIVVQLDPSKTELTQQFLQSIGQTL